MKKILAEFPLAGLKGHLHHPLTKAYWIIYGQINKLKLISNLVLPKAT